MDEEWDTLIILDACRSDLFEATVEMNLFESYKTVNSGASSTWEWTKRQFHGAAWHNTVYVSGQPVPGKALQTPFHAFLEPWRNTPSDVLATPPERVAETALTAAEMFPDKRLLIHFFQPHFGPPKSIELLENNSVEVQGIWEALNRDLVETDDVWRAYQQNLQSALDVVYQLIDTLDGNIVVSSDHGNLFHERIGPFRFEEVGHPSGLRHPNLVEVPWAVASQSESTTRDTTDTDAILSALGYLSDG